MATATKYCKPRTPGSDIDSITLNLSYEEALVVWSLAGSALPSSPCYGVYDALSELLEKEGAPYRAMATARYL